jgi:hypothetical protein
MLQNVTNINLLKINLLKLLRNFSYSFLNTYFCVKIIYYEQNY